MKTLTRSTMTILRIKRFLATKLIFYLPTMTFSMISRFKIIPILMFMDSIWGFSFPVIFPIGAIVIDAGA
jgi:hypothetical protein